MSKKKPAGLIDVPGRNGLRPHARNVDPYVAPNMTALTYVQPHQMVHDVGAPANASYEPPYGSQSPASATFTTGLPLSVSSAIHDKRLGTMQPLIGRQPIAVPGPAPPVEH